MRGRVLLRSIPGAHEGNFLWAVDGQPTAHGLGAHIGASTVSRECPNRGEASTLFNYVSCIVSLGIYSVSRRLIGIKVKWRMAGLLLRLISPVCLEVFSTRILAQLTTIASTRYQLRAYYGGKVSKPMVSMAISSMNS